jgi:hypothetical protein
MKAKQCKYCATGHRPNAQGEHWIVKSIIPARITIRKCQAFEKTAKRPSDVIHD